MPGFESAFCHSACHERVWITTIFTPS